MNQRQIWTAQIDILEVQRQKYIQRLKECKNIEELGRVSGSSWNEHDNRVNDLESIIDELNEEIYDLEQLILCLNEDV